MATSNIFSVLSLDADAADLEEGTASSSSSSSSSSSAAPRFSFGSSMPGPGAKSAKKKKKKKKKKSDGDNNDLDPLVPTLVKLNIDLANGSLAPGTSVDDEVMAGPPALSPPPPPPPQQKPDGLENKPACLAPQNRQLALASGGTDPCSTSSDNKNTESASHLKWPLVWIDLEMTGLNLDMDRILEIACIITDGRLQKMVEGPDLMINQPEESLAGMGEWCQLHHTASGLVEGVRKSKVTEREAELQVLEFVRKHIGSGTVQPLLAGNSVYVDFMFLRKYMPELASLFSHVLVDVSSIKALCFRWYPKDAERAPMKKKKHRALEDIKESIAELKYMQKTIFKETKMRS